MIQHLVVDCASPGGGEICDAQTGELLGLLDIQPIRRSVSMLLCLRESQTVNITIKNHTQPVVVYSVALCPGHGA